MPVAPLGPIGSWSSTYLTKFLNDWLRRNPLPVQDKLKISELTATNASFSGTVGFYGNSAVPQPSAPGSATGYSAGATAATFHSDDKYTGGIGTTAYTINGIVAALKTIGLVKL